ncbi:MAG: XdhC family protein [Deltaproteobacteria bacterium]
MKRSTLDALLAAATEKRAVCRIVDLESGAERIAAREDAAASAALDSDRATVDDGTFVHPFNPPLRMLIIGAVHVAQILTVMAKELGYAVTVIDPRSAFLRAERFADVERTDDWPDEALERLAPDHRTAVVLLSHDPKIDDPALAVALKSDAFYIGALGSKRTHASRTERFEARGFDAETIGRIHGPIGLDIGAKSPAEIATSIVAEITAVLRGRRPTI